ncbi:MAG: sigma-54-dependent transcriptional regulator [Candidatus Aminicenantales bacterium]
MIKDKILIIDDEAGIRSALRGILEDEGFAVKTTESGEDGLDLLKSENFDLILLDIWLPNMSGIEVLRQIKSNEVNTQVVMITGHGSVETAVKATKLGAYDFLEKPLSLEKVVLTAKNALKQKRLEEENIQLKEKFKTKYLLIGKSSSIQKLRAEIKRAAPTNGRVLIYGENGTGKELIARLIHQQSPRKNKRFIQINAAAIPDDLIENELFGYVKGSFPQAEKDKKGKLLLADGGTLFLAEIGDMSLKTQAKLVRVIEDQKFEPVGSSDSISINTRLIAATNKNLRELVSKKLFREDLFFKLNVIPLVIPPLRERKEDIPLLIDYFLKYFSYEYGKKPKTMSQEAMKAFLNYSWPGNVSELINVIERFVIMVEDEQIKASHLSLLVEPREFQYISEENEYKSLKEARENFEKEYLHRVLINHSWDIDQAAAILKIEAKHLQQKIKDLGLSFLG